MAQVSDVLCRAALRKRTHNDYQKFKSALLSEVSSQATKEDIQQHSSLRIKQLLERQVKLEQPVISTSPCYRETTAVLIALLFATLTSWTCHCRLHMPFSARHQKSRCLKLELQLMNKTTSLLKILQPPRHVCPSALAHALLQLTSRFGMPAKNLNYSG